MQGNKNWSAGFFPLTDFRTGQIHRTEDTVFKEKETGFAGLKKLGGVSVVSIYVIFGFILFLVVVVKVFFTFEGNAELNVKVNERTPFSVEKMTEDQITFCTKVEIANEGRQCGTIMDCYVRTLLPYEQYDGVEARGKAEWEKAPREDDYFEAMLIPKKEKIYILVKVTLKARKAETIQDALRHMVDLPIDLVYQHVARYPWRISKKRIVLTAPEIAELAGITLADD